MIQAPTPLFPEAVIPVPSADASDIERAAIVWMDENPRAMRLFERLALEAAKQGNKFGMKHLVERVRWEMLMGARKGRFKLNNNHTAYIARELIRRRPRLAHFLELRAAGLERSA